MKMLRYLIVALVLGFMLSFTNARSYAPYSQYEYVSIPASEKFVTATYFEGIFSITTRPRTKKDSFGVYFVYSGQAGGDSDKLTIRELRPKGGK